MDELEEYIHEWLFDDKFSIEYQQGMLTALKLHYRVTKQYDKVDIINTVIFSLYREIY